MRSTTQRRGSTLKPGSLFDPPDDLDDEALERGLVHEFASIIGAVGEQVFDPRPALADRVEDDLRASAISNIRCRQVDHEQPPVGVDRDMALAADNLLAAS